MLSAEPATDPSSSSSSKAKTQNEASNTRRIVLYPNGETLWADISLMNTRNGGTWTDQQAIEFEAKILASPLMPLHYTTNRSLSLLQLPPFA